MKPSCPCSKDPAVTIIPVGNQQVGLVGLKSLFEEWYSVNKTSEDLQSEEILASIKKRNYVSRTLEKEYVKAVRKAYANYCKSTKRKG